MRGIHHLLTGFTTFILTASLVSAGTIFWTSLEGYPNGVNGKRGVFKIDTKTKVVTNIGDTGIHGADSLLLDSQSRILYDVQTTNGELRRVNVDGTSDTLLVNGINLPQDMAFEPGGGAVLVAAYGSGEIVRVDLTTLTKTSFAAIAKPNGIAFDKDGNLFVFGDFDDHVNGAHLYWLGKYGQPGYGTIQKVSSNFDSPDDELDGLTYDPYTGYLFGSSRSAGKIYRIDPAAFISAANGTYQATLWANTIPTNHNDLGPDGVMSNLKGSLYIASRYDFRIWQCSATVSNSCSYLTADDGTALLDVAQNSTNLNGLDDLAQIAIDPPQIAKQFVPSTIQEGGVSTLTITITNPNPGTALLNVASNDILPSAPAQMTVASPLTVTNTCGGTLTATAGGSTISLSGVTLAAGASCQVTVKITAPVSGTYPNTVSATSSNGGDGQDGHATLIVTHQVDFVKSFNPPSIPAGGTTTMSFLVSNTNLSDIPGVSFTDTFPPGMTVATPVVTSNSCATGSFSPALAGGESSFTFSNLTVPASSSCTITVKVMATVISPAGTTKGDPNYNCAVLGGSVERCAALEVTVVPPVILKSFNPSTISVGGTAVLSFQITNPNASGTLSGIGFTDTLPSGMAIAAVPGVVNNCGGVLTLTPIIQLVSAGPLAAMASCTVSVNVTATTGGQLCNTTSPVTAANPAGGLLTGPPSTACLTVSTPGSDIFQIRYAANLDVGDAAVSIINAGSLSGKDPEGRICANVYAFAPTEELISCCSCMVTPNGLNSLSVNRDIMSTVLTGTKPSSIVIKLLASKPNNSGLCDPTSPNTSNLVSGMLAWGTSLHPMSSYPVTYGVTETRFTPAELSAAELSRLTTFCQFVKILGSQVTGICKSCQPGALGAVGQ